jgi:hypothetical protein
MGSPRPNTKNTRQPATLINAHDPNTAGQLFVVSKMKPAK